MTMDASPMPPHGTPFRLLGPPGAAPGTARLGCLALPGRRAIETPNYAAVTSRGAVPHLTPDNLSRHTAVGAAYLALEDFLEKNEPPILGSPARDRGRLHAFTALPPDRATILAARRCPPVPTPMGNGVKTISLLTSTGYATLTVAQFASAVEALRPDVVVALADALHTSATPASKKLFKMVERTEAWLDEFLEHVGGRRGLDELGVCLFAPVLPVEHPVQWDYLRHLAEDAAGALSGLAVYDVDVLPELVGHGPLAPLPRLSLDPPATPHALLRQIALGVDLCPLPFVNGVSDAGVALAFRFPPPAAAERALPLGADMSAPEYATSPAPLLDGCPCYACARHHAAYVHHLLNANEMLGWVLLQVHNQRVVDDFFAGVRRSLRAGPADFARGRERFQAAYEPEMPAGCGQRPRARGYHFKSEAGQQPMNKPGWSRLGGRAAEPA